MLVRCSTLKQILMVAAVVGAATLGFAEDEPAGKGLFLKNKCNMCHNVESQGIEATREMDRAPDMSDAGNFIPSAEWATKFVKREETKDGKKHMRPFKGDDEDLQAIVDWLMTLKSS